MAEDRHAVAPTEIGRNVMARRSNRRSASSRVPRNMAIGVGIALILALIEGAVWLLAFSGGGTHNISTFLSSAAHTPLFLFVLLLQLIAACTLMQVTDRPLALLRYIREVQRAQEQYRAFYTPVNSWPAVYETTIMYVQDSPDPSVPGQVQSMSMSELAQHLAPTSAAGQAHQLILGAPGAGKTMLLRLFQYVALQQGRTLIAGRAKIPIYVPLRNYSFYLEAGNAASPQEGDAGDHKGLVKIPRIFLAPHSSPPSPLREGSFPRKDGGLVGTRDDDGPRPRNGRVDKRLLSILLLIPMALSVLTMRGPIKAADGSNGGGVLITERESAYNYLQVVQVGDELQLIMNEGVGIHSVYNPHSILTQGYWDDFLVAPYFNNPPFTQNQVRKVALIGLGAGTAAREFTATYGPIPIDGVEIDSTVVELGRQYFHMTEPNLHIIVQDGRYYLQTTSQKYDVIGVDTYQQPYVPFQFTTQEFFQTVRDHLTPTGVVALNAGRTSNDYRLVEALAQTMHSVFPNVYILDTERFTNSLVIGTNAPTSLANFQINANRLTNPLLQSVAQASIVYGNIREEHSRTVYFTDDRAPVEQLIDQIILDAVENQGK